MNKKKILYCILISITFLLICTKSSPLYRINDWYDAQCFFTVGKSMINGKIPYLDLFEQKGPLLFLLYGIASLISNNSFIGVFILEVISYSVFLYYVSKIIEIYLDKKYSYILIPIIALLMLPTRCFTHGGSCEEFCFPVLAILIYKYIKYLKNNDISSKDTIIVGILSGILLWMKYTLLGFSIGFCITVLIKSLIDKNYKNLISKVGYFTLGITITTIPWLIYFGLHKNGIKSLIDVYFLFNINSYANNYTLLQKLINCFNTIKGVIFRYYQYLILIIIPMVLSIKTKTFFKETKNNIYLLISTLLLLITIFIGGTNFRYYSLPIQPFMIFGLIFIATIIKDKRINNIILNNTKYIVPIIIIVCLFISYYRSPNTKYISKNKSYYAQYTFLDSIKPNSSILNYGFLDGGFYFTTKTYPNQYYFQRNNIIYELFPNNTDEQKRYIKEKQTDYVIINNELAEDELKIIKENYNLIDSHTQQYEEYTRTYYLYEKK